ncbi:MAG: GNAT family N-acetyltransferase [Candidatus Cloacimonadota bacterium]|nr:GNAT family N-acetyltransferase [Candidatus Cloacimonadota bacterium]
MKKIIFLNSKQDITSEMIDGFFVGWQNAPNNQTFLNILGNSYKIVLAVSNKKLVGFITAISDGILSAYIPFLEVLPQFQNKGIGAELVNRMKEELNNIYMVDLICDKSLEKYYKKFGFTKYSGMILRNYEFQNGTKENL